MKKILAFGEVLWDLLPSGKQIGGAPGNFAYHARVLGNDAFIVSSVGDDTLGEEVFSTFQPRGVPTDFLRIDPDRPTGTVEVELTADGQPSYRIVENVAWDKIVPNRAVLDFAQCADAVCFGSLACRSAENRAALDEILALVPKEALVVFDLNLRKPFYSAELVERLLSSCNVFKLNDDELAVLAELRGVKFAEKTFFDPDGQTLAPEKRRFVERFMREFHLEFCILTCGSRGSFLFDHAGNESFAPATPVEVVSTVGAGDAFTAICVSGFLAGKPLDAINKRASRYAAFVCTGPGGMPKVPDEWKDEWK